MSDLQNQTPANTYKGLLQVGDYTNGVDSTAKYVSDGEGTNSALSISESKVGVGTTSPSAELDVVGSIEATTLTTSGQVGAGSVDVSGNVVADEYALDGTGASSSAVAIHAPAPNELAIRTSSTEAMRIDSNGHVGISTANPSAELDVVGSAIIDGTMKVNGLLYNNANSTEFQSNQTTSVTVPSVAEGSVYHVVATRHTADSNSQLRVAYVHYSEDGTANLNDSVANSNVNLTVSGSTITVTNNATQATLSLRILKVG